MSEIPSTVLRTDPAHPLPPSPTDARLLDTLAAVGAEPLVLSGNMLQGQASEVVFVVAAIAEQNVGAAICIVHVRTQAARPRLREVLVIDCAVQLTCLLKLVDRRAHLIVAQSERD